METELDFQGINHFCRENHNFFLSFAKSQAASRVQHLDGVKVEKGTKQNPLVMIAIY